MNGTVTHRTVIVVGSGPTGLLLAGDLATAGVNVTLVEKRPHKISNLSRAFGVRPHPGAARRPRPRRRTPHHR